DRVVALVPVGNHAPRLAVPLMNARKAGAFVVLAGELEWTDHAFEAELLDPLLRDIEVLKAPPDLLTRERLLAELRLSRADGLHADHRVDDAAVVENVADLVRLRRALPLAVDVLLDLVVDRVLTRTVL